MQHLQRDPDRSVPGRSRQYTRKMVLAGQVMENSDINLAGQHDDGTMYMSKSIERENAVPLSAVAQLHKHRGC